MDVHPSVHLGAAQIWYIPYRSVLLAYSHQQRLISNLKVGLKVGYLKVVVGRPARDISSWKHL